MTRRIALSTFAALLGALVLSTGLARADVGKKTQKALSGTILLTEKVLPTDMADNAATVKAYKGMAKKSFTHTVDDGVPTWRFHYMAFLKASPKTTSLSFDFYTDDKEKLYVADKRFTGIDPKLRILSGFMTISEDDNVAKGRSYVVKLTGKVRGKERVFATTKVSFK